MREAAQPTENVVPALTPATVLRLYLPLAFSWVLMATDGPMSIGVISRLPRPEVNSAAFLIMMSLAMWIESPVIDLLSTSTTLAKSRARVKELTRFALRMIFFVTAAHSLVALTPLYEVFTQTLLGVRAEVAETARAGVIIMIPWSGMIGWRRHWQGVLIRCGQTRPIGFGTVVRIAAMAGTALGLYGLSSMSGVSIAATALVVSVGAEAAFIHFIARAVLADPSPALDAPSSDGPLTQSRLLSFHLPLTGTTLLNLATLPIISAALARMPHPLLSLASYEVANTIIYLHRAATYGLPETVIALLEGQASRRVLARFSGIAGAGLSGIMLLLVVAGQDRAIFSRILGASPPIVETAHVLFTASCALPFLDSIHGYIRGVLTAYHQTVSRLVAVVAGVVALGAVLVLGVALAWSGPLTAALALTLSLLAEIVVLAWHWTRRKGDIVGSEGPLGATASG